MFEQVAMDFPPVLCDADHKRLARQRVAVWTAMLSGRWLTLAELEEATLAPQASISARLRDFRQSRFGGHTVERRRRNGPGTPVHEYRLIANL